MASTAPPTAVPVRTVPARTKTLPCVTAHNGVVDKLSDEPSNNDAGLDFKNTPGINSLLGQIVYNMALENKKIENVWTHLAVGAVGLPVAVACILLLDKNTAQESRDQARGECKRINTWLRLAKVLRIADLDDNVDIQKALDEYVNWIPKLILAGWGDSAFPKIIQDELQRNSTRDTLHIMCSAAKEEGGHAPEWARAVVLARSDAAGHEELLSIVGNDVKRELQFCFDAPSNGKQFLEEVKSQWKEHTSGTLAPEQIRFTVEKVFLPLLSLRFISLKRLWNNLCKLDEGVDDDTEFYINNFLAKAEYALMKEDDETRKKRVQTMQRTHLKMPPEKTTLEKVCIGLGPLWEGKLVNGKSVIGLLECNMHRNLFLYTLHQTASANKSMFDKIVRELWRNVSWATIWDIIRNGVTQPKAVEGLQFLETVLANPHTYIVLNTNLSKFIEILVTNIVNNYKSCNTQTADRNLNIQRNIRKYVFKQVSTRMKKIGDRFVDSAIAGVAAGSIATFAAPAGLAGAGAAAAATLVAAGGAAALNTLGSNGTAPSSSTTSGPVSTSAPPSAGPSPSTTTSRMAPHSAGPSTTSTITPPSAGRTHSTADSTTAGTPSTAGAAEEGAVLDSAYLFLVVAMVAMVATAVAKRALIA